eukprot:11284000-Alexandrium_andersonii.AAC.1
MVGWVAVWPVGPCLHYITTRSSGSPLLLEAMRVKTIKVWPAGATETPTGTNTWMAGGVRKA